MPVSLENIRFWFLHHQRRQRYGESVPSMSDIADMAGLSRQTLYAILRDERSEFGEVAQIRLSRVIVQISADPAYQHSKLMRVNLSSDTPRLQFGFR